MLKRPFIFMGQVAFVCLLLLAITSTNGWMRRLKKNWGRLHRLVYVAAVAGVIHFIWIQKSDISEPPTGVLAVGRSRDPDLLRDRQRRARSRPPVRA